MKVVLKITQRFTLRPLRQSSRRLASYAHLRVYPQPVGRSPFSTTINNKLKPFSFIKLPMRLFPLAFLNKAFLNLFLQIIK
nr:hypothetical protein [Klebsiella variicola]